MLCWLDWSWESDDDFAPTALSVEELKNYDFYDTRNNPPQVQALLYLQLVAEQVSSTIVRIHESHQLGFELARQPSPTLGRFSLPLHGGCEMISATNLDEMETSLLPQDFNPDRVLPPRDHLHHVSIDEQPAGRHRLDGNKHNDVAGTENRSDCGAQDVDSLSRAWCPTWWEYIDSCRQTLHADQFVLITRADGLDHLTEKSEKELEYLNVVSARATSTATSPDWVEIVSPTNTSCKATFAPFYAESGTGLLAWANAVRPASSPITTKGSLRATTLRTAMGDAATGVIQRDILTTCVSLGNKLSCQRYYYKLDLAEAFPTCLAVLVRAGGQPFAREELSFYRATVDVVASQLRLALLTNACRTRAARINFALSIPATLVDVDGSPRDRLMLMLRKTCETIHCSSACLSIFNPAWEEMQIVAGWPPLLDNQLITFPEYKRTGKPVMLDDGITLRASIVGRNSVVLGVLDLVGFSSGGLIAKEIEFVHWGVTKWFEFLLEKLALENIVEEVATEKQQGDDDIKADPDTWETHGVHALDALERSWDESEMNNHQQVFQNRLIKMLKVEP